MPQLFEPPIQIDRFKLVKSLLNGLDIKNLLEIGCGNGLFLLYYLKNNDNITLKNYLGVDLIEKDLNTFRNSLINFNSQINFFKDDINVKLILNDFNNLKFSDNFANNSDVYEAYLLIEVIEHLDDKDYDSFINLTFNVFKPKYVILTTPNYSFNHRFISRPTKYRHDDHKFEFNLKEFKEFCSNIERTYNYTYKFGGLGEAIVSDVLKSSTNEEDIYPTHWVIFTRNFDHNISLEDANKDSKLIPFSSIRLDSLKDLRLKSNDEIIQLLKLNLELPFVNNRLISSSIHSVWFDNLKIACLNDFNNLINAIKSLNNFRGYLNNLHDDINHDDTSDFWYLCYNNNSDDISDLHIFYFQSYDDFVNANNKLDDDSNDSDFLDYDYDNDQDNRSYREDDNNRQYNDDNEWTDSINYQNDGDDWDTKSDYYSDDWKI